MTRRGAVGAGGTIDRKGESMIRRLTLFAVLMLAAGATAQINQPHNEFGMYAVPDPEGCATAQIDVSAGSWFTAYLVLTSPWNDELDQPVATIGAVEFKFVMPDGVALLGMVWPPFSEWWPSPDGEYLVGMHAPVTGDRVVLVTCTLLAQSADPSFFYLRPVETAPASIPGSMAFTDYDHDYALLAMVPVSGSPDVPVFAVNWEGDLSFCETVPDRETSFGSLQALYR